MKDSRRQFLKIIGFPGTVALFPLSDLSAFNLFELEEGFVINETEQETFLIGGRQAPVTIIIDKKRKGVNTISLCREDIIPEDEIPVHKHANEDEIIFIQYGKGLLTLGEKIYEVKEGSAAFIPKEVWHGLKNNGSENIRMIFNYAPSGFENYFREIGTPKGVQWVDKTNEEWLAINTKYGITYKSK